MFDPQLCYAGFLDWNDFRKKSFDKENSGPDMFPLKNVHIYYENWVKSKMGDSEDFLEFRKLWEIVMIRSTSEAICETVGSMMNQHCGHNRHLEAEYFNMEMVLRVNLGPLHHLEGLISDVLSNDPTKFYIRKETMISQVVSQDINKSAAIASFQKNNEKKSRFPSKFWLSNSEK